MSFFEIAEKRYSLRNFDTREVENEKILKVLEAARIAPSACNFQPYHFIVITDEGLRKKISECFPRDWFKKAPVIIVACGDHSKSWKRSDGKDHCDVDVAIAVDHITLAAADLGLGTCWVCAFDAEKCHEILNLPEHLEVIALLPMGYPAEGAAVPKKQRKNIEEIVSWNHFGTKI
ncbi:MAG: nitroreductase [Clostridiaceae bacterium]|nr:nitroreductase [Clostridiaceae bacterium]